MCDRKTIEKVASAMGACGAATGHGDTLDDLLSEWSAQYRELAGKLDAARAALAAELERCAMECGDRAVNWREIALAFKGRGDEVSRRHTTALAEEASLCAAAIRALPDGG